MRRRNFWKLLLLTWNRAQTVARTRRGEASGLIGEASGRDGGPFVSLFSADFYAVEIIRGAGYLDYDGQFF